jgi:hypothetical protein
MFDKLVSYPLQKGIGLYIILVIGNETTQIINNSIDTSLEQIDGMTAVLLEVIRFLINFEGAAVLAVVGFITWYVYQVKS